MISGLVAVFLCGAFGGVLAEILHWYQLRESPSLPTYARSPFYWGITIAMIAAGGVVAVLYGTEPHNAILVLQIGVSTPLIIKALAQAKAPEPGRGPSAPSVQGFAMSEAPERASLMRFLAGR